MSDSIMKIPYITGDGIGQDITPVMIKVVDAAVRKAYPDRRIEWIKVLAGREARIASGLSDGELKSLTPEEKHEIYLPPKTLQTIRKHKIAIKGPLETPVGEGFRSLNVVIRKKLDLYATFRPCKWYPGTPAPLKHPEKLDVVIFRENLEDVYAGIEWKSGSPDAKKVIDFLSEMGHEVPDDSAIGVKPISETGSKRLIRSAIRYAIENNRRSVTLVHKGNIMKYTEGAFRTWGYEVAETEFKDQTVKETDLKDDSPPSKVVIKDRIADQMFQQLLLRPNEYDVIATMNLNGDYLSDACSAEIGGLGMAPGANINFETGTAVFEPTHGTAPRHAGLNEANPSSLILTAVMMLRFIQWEESADLIENALIKTILNKKVTYDLHRQMESATLVSTSEFGDEIIKNLTK